MYNEILLSIIAMQEMQMHWEQYFRYHSFWKFLRGIKMKYKNWGKYDTPW
jgi:hypothetical protein